MKLGVVFPQTEIGSDPGAIRAYAQAAEDFGYHHLIAFDQVVGLNPASRPDWQGVDTYRDLFHEPLVLFGYLEAVTERLELVTGVLVLPQRQTALVAKQAAEVDVLSRGRLRLGVGVGLKADEYAALDAAYHDRGRRSEEQCVMAEEHPSPPEDLRQLQAENRSLRSQIETLTNNSAEMHEELQTITGQRDKHYRAMRRWRGLCIVVAAVAVIEFLILVF